MNSSLIKSFKIGLSFIFVFSSSAWAEDAIKIMQKVDLNTRGQSNSSSSLLKISTCKFGIKNKKIKCTEEPQIKSIESISINVGAEKKDRKSLAFIYEPPSERGVGMLMHSYDSIFQDNETWLYLSALGKVKRIVSSNSGNLSEPTSIFGSEFTTEDQESGKIDSYNYRIIKKEVYKGVKTFVIERIPNAEKALRSRYAKTILWVDAEKFVVLKAKIFDYNGTEIRRLLSSNLQKINNIWLARVTTILNLETRRLSSIALSGIQFGIPIESNFFSTRALTDKAFRKRWLDQIRSFSGR